MSYLQIQDGLPKHFSRRGIYCRNTIVYRRIFYCKFNLHSMMNLCLYILLYMSTVAKPARQFSHAMQI